MPNFLLFLIMAGIVAVIIWIISGALWAILRTSLGQLIVLAACMVVGYVLGRSSE